MRIRYNRTVISLHDDEWNVQLALVFVFFEEACTPYTRIFVQFFRITILKRYPCLDLFQNFGSGVSSCENTTTTMIPKQKIRNSISTSTT